MFEDVPEITFESEWDRCGPWLQAALDRMPEPTHGLDDVKAMVMRRDARFWAGREAAMVTTIQTYPRLTSLTFWLAGGDLDELRDELRPAAEDYGRAHGATWATIYGRKGWSRALDYEPIHFTCAKRL